VNETKEVHLKCCLAIMTLARVIPTPFCIARTRYPRTLPNVRSVAIQALKGTYEVTNHV